MSVMRHWRRSVLGASGVALLLPLGLMLGVALTTALGGGVTLRALDQVLHGPAGPSARSAPGLESARDVPAVPLRGGARDAEATTGTAVPGGAPARPTTTTTGPTPSPDGPPPPSPPSPPPAPGPSGGGGGPPAPSAPQSPPPPSGSAVHQAGQTAADGVAALPAPVGPSAGGAMQTVVDLIP